MQQKNASEGCLSVSVPLPAPSNVWMFTRMLPALGQKNNQQLRRHNWHFLYAQCRSLKVQLATRCPSETAALLLFQHTHRDLHNAGMHFIRGHSCQPLPSVCHLPLIGSFFPLTPVTDPYVKYATEEINEIIRDLIWIFD